jgi:hypothetical protein
LSLPQPGRVVNPRAALGRVVHSSRARGDYTLSSDYDLLVGLREDDGKRLIDRMAEFDPLVEGGVEFLPYGRSEWERMFGDLNPLILDALEHGIVLWNRGGFAAIRETFRRWRAQGLLEPWRSGWRINA